MNEHPLMPPSVRRGTVPVITAGNRHYGRSAPGHGTDVRASLLRLFRSGDRGGKVMRWHRDAARQHPVRPADSGQSSGDVVAASDGLPVESFSQSSKIGVKDFLAGAQGEMGQVGSERGLPSVPQSSTTVASPPAIRLRAWKSP